MPRRSTASSSEPPAAYATSHRSGFGALRPSIEAVAKLCAEGFSLLSLILRRIAGWMWTALDHDIARGRANNTAGFAAAMREMHAAGQAQRAAAAQDEIDMLNADPFDPEVRYLYSTPSGPLSHVSRHLAHVDTECFAVGQS